MAFCDATTPGGVMNCFELVSKEGGKEGGKMDGCPLGRRRGVASEVGPEKKSLWREEKGRIILSSIGHVAEKRRQGARGVITSPPYWEKKKKGRRKGGRDSWHPRRPKGTLVIFSRNNKRERKSRNLVMDAVAEKKKKKKRREGGKGCSQLWGAKKRDPSRREKHIPMPEKKGEGRGKEGKIITSGRNKEDGDATHFLTKEKAHGPFSGGRKGKKKSSPKKRDVLGVRKKISTLVWPLERKKGGGPGAIQKEKRLSCN